MSSNNSTPSSTSRQRNQYKRKHKRKDKSQDSDFVCQLQFLNRLPELPYEPKFLKCPLDDKRYIRYEPTTLERDLKQELVCGIDVGVCLDLIDSTSFIPPKNPPPLDPIDRQLIEGASKSSSRNSSNVAFLLHPQYLITNENEIRMPSNLTSVFRDPHYHENREEHVSLNNREKQIEDILATFEAAKQIPKHPTNAKLKPVEIFPLLPDEDLWGNEYSEMIFDSAPVEPEEDETPQEATRKRKNAIIKSVSSPHQELASFRYFVPKRRRLDDEESQDDQEETEFDVVRDYTYRVHKNDGLYFVFIWKDKEVTYHELRMKVLLQKVPKEGDLHSNTRVTLGKLPFISTYAQQQLDQAREVLKDQEAKRN